MTIIMLENFGFFGTIFEKKKKKRKTMSTFTRQLVTPIESTTTHIILKWATASVISMDQQSSESYENQVL